MSLGKVLLLKTPQRGEGMADVLLPLDYKELSGGSKIKEMSTAVATACEGWATRRNVGVSPQPLPLAMTSTLEDVQENWTQTLASSPAPCQLCR